MAELPTWHSSAAPVTDEWSAFDEFLPRNQLLGPSLRQSPRVIGPEDYSTSPEDDLETRLAAIAGHSSSGPAHRRFSWEAESEQQLPAPGGYMGRSSPFSIDEAPGEMSFINWYPKGDSTITYSNDNGTVETISQLNPWIIEERCPLLAQAFEDSRSGPQLHLEALTSATAMPFLKFLYTGTYAASGLTGDVYEDVPTSVLLHCRLYQLGDIYELPDLKSQAYVNVLRQCEFGCSSPDKPIDLCDAIKFVYEHLRQHTALVETIVSYCVSCFLIHNLGQDTEFRELAYDLRPFHQDLCKESIDRQFENETAAAIIQMPFRTYSPASYASREDAGAARFNDTVYHFHGNDDPEHFSKKRKRPENAPNAPLVSPVSTLSLALRQKHKSENEVVKTELGVIDGEDDTDAQYRKRRASSANRLSADNADSSSDEGYHIVSGPAPVEDLGSESDSDASTVVVEYPNPESHSQQTALPIRGRPAAPVANRAAIADNADCGFDSEWQLL